MDPYDPSTWDIESDDAIIRRAFNAARSAFLERGAEAGITALADLAWPDRTADELLVCFWGGTTYAELDEEELVIDHRWENLLSDEGWEVFGKVPSDEGWRVYLADLTITTSRRFAGRSEQDVESSTAHVAVNEEDEVVWFPDC